MFNSSDGHGLNHPGAKGDACTGSRGLSGARAAPGSTPLSARAGLGVVALLLGVVLPESRKKAWYLIGSERFVVVPQFGSATLGLGATGKF